MATIGKGPFRMEEEWGDLHLAVAVDINRLNRFQAKQSKCYFLVGWSAIQHKLK